MQGLFAALSDLPPANSAILPNSAALLKLHVLKPYRRKVFLQATRAARAIWHNIITKTEVLTTFFELFRKSVLTGFAVEKMPFL